MLLPWQPCRGWTSQKPNGAAVNHHEGKSFAQGGTRQGRREEGKVPGVGSTALPSPQDTQWPCLLSASLCYHRQERSCHDMDFFLSFRSWACSVSVGFGLSCSHPWRLWQGASPCRNRAQTCFHTYSENKVSPFPFPFSHF